MSLEITALRSVLIFCTYLVLKGNVQADYVYLIEPVVFFESEGKKTLTLMIFYNIHSKLTKKRRSPSLENITVNPILKYVSYIKVPTFSFFIIKNNILFTQSPGLILFSLFQSTASKQRNFKWKFFFFINFIVQ